MENDSPLRVLLVTEGSGGHLIPALQVASSLAKTGARVKLWYAERGHTASLAGALTQEATAAFVDVDSIPMGSLSTLFGRLWRCGQLWHKAQHCFDSFSPDVVVGFGGWVSAPVVLAARAQHIGCLLHEQNVVMGRANRLLTPWVDRVAVSFHDTQAMLNGASTVVTGMPVREEIGRASRSQSAQRFGFSPNRPTLLILGGSQGSRAINRLMTRVVALWSPEERETWQVLHVTGPTDEALVKQAYAACGIRAWTAPFLVEMEEAYAQADLAIARAGSSTIAELARCGLPAILIPYPYAGGHQRANAQLVEAVGGGLMIEEDEASPERLLGAVRRILSDQRLRIIMGAQLRALSCPDAAARLTRAIVELAHARLHRCIQPDPVPPSVVLKPESACHVTSN